MISRFHGNCMVLSTSWHFYDCYYKSAVARNHIRASS
jgi:hypothetical protein